MHVYDFHNVCLDTPQGVAQELVSAGLINGVDVILGKAVYSRVEQSIYFSFIGTTALHIISITLNVEHSMTQ
jgi:hypothetical protein